MERVFLGWLGGYGVVFANAIAWVRLVVVTLGEERGKTLAFTSTF